ncbi:CinA-like protein [uncultured Eubacteriales bacterium]|uniref:Putative competence-damage inducible protein n=1 Tax=uncultured Eubacteriales bacterium TaxID=172733 RepID=A0A212KIY0_9FIRM|nr:CinA-like protein [uncultured Eubacteriales bacterium]
MSYTAELIAVGTELLLGNIANTDAQMLSKGLSALGINVYYHTVVGDNPDRLRTAVEVAKTRADIIITTGGLGPTCDDLTKNVLADCFGKRLVYDKDSAQRIRDYFGRLHRDRAMTENNLQQAWLPEGCTIFPNDWGTAPGCAFEADGIHVIMLPGPPGECAPMFRYRAVPYLEALSDGVILSCSLRIFGMGESAVEDKLRDRMNSMRNPTLAPYAKTGEVELRITAKSITEGAALALIAPVEKELRAMFGPLVYGVDVGSLEEVVLNELKQRRLSIGTAESLTGGLAAKRLTDVPGASAAFKGAIVSYTNEVKETALGVSGSLLWEKGAVCPEVASAMAEGARKALRCDVALSFTGVAGPDNDEKDNPVGLVYVGLATADGVRVRELHLGGDRDRIRTTAASHGFDMARRWLAGLPDKDE